MMRQKQVYSVVKRPNIPAFGGKKPSRREGIKEMGILENAIERIWVAHSWRINPAPACPVSLILVVNTSSGR
jgi:hypothetical protein